MIRGHSRIYTLQHQRLLTGESAKMQFFGKLMGDPNKKDLRVIQPVVDKINTFEPAMKKLSDEDLAAKTAEFRSQLFLHLRGGMVLEDELVKLFKEVLAEVEPRAKQCS